VGASVTYDFNRWFGLTVDSSGQWGSGNTGVAARIDQVEFSTSPLAKITFSHALFFPVSRSFGANTAWRRKSSGTISLPDSWLAAVLM